jgi:hypothetical protein
MNTLCLLVSISQLPDELIREIYNYIPFIVLVFINKTNYNLYHKLIRRTIPHYENYIRDVVRRDNEFVFYKIVEENYTRWVNIKKYIYKNTVYNNYISFLIDYCIQNASEKCRNSMMIFLKNVGLCQNQHKKNVCKHIRWKKLT